MPQIDRPADPSAGKPDREVQQLGFIVEQEARRTFSEAQLKADPALEAEGWQRRFITDGRRAREVIDLYTELGYEVRAEPVEVEEMDEECEDCQVLILLQFKTIYTRKKQEPGGKN